MLSQWQWHRYQARHSLNAEVAANAHQQPVPVGELATPGASLNSANLWRVVSATGKYDEAAQVLVRLKTINDDTGFWVATPLVTTNGTILMVNRGWVPATGDASVAPIAPPPPAGPVEVTGVLQQSESGPASEASDIPRGEVTGLDVNRAATQLRAPVYSGYINLTSSEPAQADGLTLIPLPQQDDGPHLSYTMQWIAFSVMAIVGWFILVRREAKWQKRERDDGDDDADDPQAAEPDARSQDSEPLDAPR